MNVSGESGFPSHRPSLLGSHDFVTALAGGVVNTVVALPLNGYVLVLISTRARETLASDFFSLNLALSEIIFSFFILCYVAFVALESYAYLEAFIFSVGLMYTGRPLFQSLICVDCYIGVVHPVLFLRYKPLRYRVACCCIAWLITLSFCIYSKYTYTQTLYLYGFVIQNLLYLSVMLFCCLAVAKALKQPGPVGKTADKKKKKSNTVKRRAFKIILLIMTFITINSLLFIAAVPSQCCLDGKRFSRVFTACVAVALATGFIQPLLYLHRNGKLICCKKL